MRAQEDPASGAAERAEGRIAFSTPMLTEDDDAGVQPIGERANGFRRLSRDHMDVSVIVRNVRKVHGSANFVFGAAA